MMHGLSKSKCSGGLCLSYAFALPLISFCCCASSEKQPQGELTREMYKHSWRAHLSEAWKCADIKKKTWWKASKYEDSIFEAIPQIVANCISPCYKAFNYINAFNQNQFRLIEFCDATPDKMKYSSANWNALVLANFIYQSLTSKPGVMQSYNKILDTVVSGLKHYYSTNDAKEVINTLNPDFLRALEKAKSDIEQYVSSEGVDLARYMSEIKDINEKDRISKAPHARISTIDLNDDINSVIASYPNNNIDKYPAWVEYKVRYDNDIHPKEVIKGNDNWNVMPIYTVPEGVVEYTDDILDAKNVDERRGKKIFKLMQEEDLRNAIKNELPQKYSLSYLVRPDKKTKEQLDNESIDYFVKRIATVVSPTSVISSYEIPNTVTATTYLNQIMRTAWNCKKSVTKLKETTKFERDKLKDLKHYFFNSSNSTNSNYDDEKLMDALRNNNFDLGEAYSSLFK